MRLEGQLTYLLSLISLISFYSKSNDSASLRSSSEFIVSGLHPEIREVEAEDHQRPTSGEYAESKRSWNTQP